MKTKEFHCGESILGMFSTLAALAYLLIALQAGFAPTNDANLLTQAPPQHSEGQNLQVAAILLH